MFGRLRWLVGFVAVLTTSCGLRVPVDDIHPMRNEVAAVSTSHANPDGERDPDVLVWMVSDSWHTGMVFPYDWLLESGFVPPAGFGNPRFVVMSWGNHDAYSKEGFDHPWKVFRVLFTPTKSVMEMIPAKWDVVGVCVGQRVWRKLVPRDRGPAVAAFLNSCSEFGEDGRPIVVAESSWGNGVQLAGRYYYFIPRVCNVWTAQVIESLGGKTRPWFGLTAEGLIRQAEKPPNDFELIWPGGEIEE